MARSQVVLAEVSQKIHEATIDSRVRESKKDNSKKLASKWTTENQRVIRVFSAEDGWNSGTGMPSYTDFVDELSEKTMSNTIQVVRSTALKQGWPGCILREGLTQFLRKGLGNPNKTSRPEGFSVLFFHSADTKEEDDPDFDAQHVRETFNEKKEMTDQVVKAVSKNKIFFPTTVHQAVDMLNCAVNFLEMVCGAKTIATGSYNEGLSLIAHNRRTFEVAANSDKAFLVRFLSLLDREFQNFHETVSIYAGDEDPIGDLLGRGLRSTMEIKVRSLLAPWIDYSCVFAFRAPSDIEVMLESLSGHAGGRGIRDMDSKHQGSSSSEKKGGGSGASGRTAGGARSTGGNTPADRREDDPSWWLRLPEDERVTSWALPEGRNFREFFGQEKRANANGMPFFKHHKRSSRNAQICLKHQITKDCLRGGGCDFAHVRPKDIPADKHKIISEKLRDVYRKEGAI